MTPVLADTSVWIAHFRLRDDRLAELLSLDAVFMHPLVFGEIACGTPPDRARTLAALADLRIVRQASLRETTLLVERERLFGQGCGLVDLMLLASTLITPQARLWTHDKRLEQLAHRFGIAHVPAVH